jgi:hypothetical protein
MGSALQPYDAWLEEILERIDLDEAELALCRRWYKFGTMPYSAIEAIREIRAREDELDQRQDEYLDHMTALQRICHFQMMRGR